jgi:predicted Zn-dependent peptidase
VRRFLLAVIVLSGLALSARAADPPVLAPAPGATDVRKKLENGLEVLILPSARARSIVVLTAFGAGSRHEAPAEAGAAQLVARLLRDAACGPREAHAAELELNGLAGLPKGGTGGDAYHDLTFHYATVPEGQLGAALEIERDRLSALKPTAKLLDEERAACFAELALASVKPEARARSVLAALVYGESGLGRSRFGTPQTVSSMTLETVEAWRLAHLRLDDALLVIVGVHDAKAALDAVESKLGKLAAPGGARLAAPPLPLPVKGPQRASVDGPVAARELLLGFRGPEPGSDDEAGFLALALELRDRLGPELKGYAKEFHVGADARSNAPALLSISVTPRPSISIADVESRVQGALASVRTDAPGDLAKLRARVASGLARLTAPLDPQLAASKDEPATLVEAALDRAVAEPLLRRREALEKRLAALTSESFLATARSVLADDRACIVAIEPAK